MAGVEGRGGGCLRGHEPRVHSQLSSTPVVVTQSPWTGRSHSSGLRWPRPGNSSGPPLVKGLPASRPVFPGSHSRSWREVLAGTKGRTLGRALWRAPG